MEWEWRVEGKATLKCCTHHVAILTHMHTIHMRMNAHVCIRTDTHLLRKAMCSVRRTSPVFIMMAWKQLLSKVHS